jgi:predicted acylesterase/phospholipase RssA
LTFSGGGICSATFSLGVIQALVEKGKFKSVDYLSTVSGGGYIGSCVSSVLNHPYADDACFKNIQR